MITKNGDVRYSKKASAILDRYVGKFTTKEEWVEALAERIADLEAEKRNET